MPACVLTPALPLPSSGDRLPNLCLGFPVFKRGIIEYLLSGVVAKIKLVNSREVPGAVPVQVYVRVCHYLNGVEMGLYFNPVPTLLWLPGPDHAHYILAPPSPSVRPRLQALATPNIPITPTLPILPQS